MTLSSPQNGVPASTVPPPGSDLPGAKCVILFGEQYTRRLRSFETEVLSASRMTDSKLADSLVSRDRQIDQYLSPIAKFRRFVLSPATTPFWGSVSIANIALANLACRLHSF